MASILNKKIMVLVAAIFFYIVAVTGQTEDSRRGSSIVDYGADYAISETGAPNWVPAETPAFPQGVNAPKFSMKNPVGWNSRLARNIDNGQMWEYNVDISLWEQFVLVDLGSQSKTVATPIDALPEELPIGAELRVLSNNTCYTILATNTTGYVPDTAMLIPLDNGRFALAKPVNGKINFETFGIKPNTTDNQYYRLRRAFEAQEVGIAPILKADNGTYNFDVTLPSISLNYSNFYLEGSENTEFIIAPSNGSIKNFITFQAGSDTVSVKDIHFRSSPDFVSVFHTGTVAPFNVSSNIKALVFAAGTTDVTVDNCVFTDVHEGLNGNDVANITIKNCEFYDCEQGSFLGNCFDIQMDNCLSNRENIFDRIPEPDSMIPGILLHHHYMPSPAQLSVSNCHWVGGDVGSDSLLRTTIGFFIDNLKFANQGATDPTCKVTITNVTSERANAFSAVGSDVTYNNVSIINQSQAFAFAGSTEETLINISNLNVVNDSSFVTNIISNTGNQNVMVSNLNSRGNARIIVGGGNTRINGGHIIDWNTRDTIGGFFESESTLGDASNHILSNLTFEQKTSNPMASLGVIRGDTSTFHNIVVRNLDMDSLVTSGLFPTFEPPLMRFKKCDFDGINHFADNPDYYELYNCWDLENWEPLRDTEESKMRSLNLSSVMVIPRLTTTERNLLSLEDGLIIFNTTTNTFQGYNGSAWNDF